MDVKLKDLNGAMVDEDHKAMLLEILPLVSKLEPLSLKFGSIIDDTIPKLISSPVRVLETIRDLGRQLWEWIEQRTVTTDEGRTLDFLMDPLGCW